MSDVVLMVARCSAVVVLDGNPHRVRRGRTTAHADARIVRERPELWRPLPIDYAAEPAAPPAPSPKDVRAWAKAEGVDVPARGPIPDDVIERYQAAKAG